MLRKVGFAEGGDSTLLSEKNKQVLLDNFGELFADGNVVPVLFLHSKDKIMFLDKSSLKKGVVPKLYQKAVSGKLEL